MSKSRNSKIYQSSHGEDLEYENLIFGVKNRSNGFNKKIKFIENRRIQRTIKQNLFHGINYEN